jgi:uncharacterized protein
MKLERAPTPEGDASIVRRYGDGFVVVNEDTITTSAILTARDIDTSWPPETFEQLEAGHIEALLNDKPDIALIGTGQSQRFPRPDVVAPLHDAGVGVEVMTTPAACRTFNILMNEGRKVTAALLMIHRESDA